MMNKDGLRLGVIGFLLGSLLPAIATFNECARGSGFTWGRAIGAQLTSPLLLMLDALPLLLAIWGYFAGSRLGGLRLSKELSQLSVVLVAISIVPLSLFVYVLE